MKYTPKTEEQLDREALLPDGAYDFEIIEVSDRPSKRGNEMITLKLRVFAGDETERHIFDYIVLGTNFGERKLRHAANSCGLMHIYEAGTLTDKEFLGKTGRLSLKQEDGTGQFPPRNTLNDYLPKADTASPSKKSIKEIVDDDIPF